MGRSQYNIVCLNRDKGYVSFEVPKEVYVYVKQLEMYIKYPTRRRHKMTNHSKLPPSSAARRMACPGSRAMSERHGRNEESEASIEGTIAHEIAASILINTHLNNVVYNALDHEEAFEGARYYASVVFNYLEFPHVEQRVSCANIHPEMWGTPDAWGIGQTVNSGDVTAYKTLHVFDYKFGHTPVDAFENWQLLAYACGIGAIHPDITHIYLHIVQPRDFISPSRHKVWKLTAEELGTYYQRLVTSEALAMSASPELKVGAECKYCPARHACVALRSAAFGATELAYRDVPQGIEPRHIGHELKLLEDAAELLDFRITALRTEVQHLIQAGVNVNNYEIALSEGRMTWSIPTAKVLEIGLLAGIDLQKKDVITPTQALKAGLSQEEIVKYTERKQSLKLSRTDVNKARAVFSNT